MLTSLCHPEAQPKDPSFNYLSGTSYPLYLYYVRLRSLRYGSFDYGCFAPSAQDDKRVAFPHVILKRTCHPERSEGSMDPSATPQDDMFVQDDRGVSG